MTKPETHRDDPPPTLESIELIEQAHQYVEQLKADGQTLDGYPWWHGWAVREAYIAGFNAARAALAEGERT